MNHTFAVCRRRNLRRPLDPCRVVVDHVNESAKLGFVGIGDVACPSGSLGGMPQGSGAAVGASDSGGGADDAAQTSVHYVHMGMQDVRELGACELLPMSTQTRGACTPYPNPFALFKPRPLLSPPQQVCFCSGC